MLQHFIKCSTLSNSYLFQFFHWILSSKLVLVVAFDLFCLQLVTLFGLKFLNPDFAILQTSGQRGSGKFGKLVHESFLPNNDFDKCFLVLTELMKQVLVVEKPHTTHPFTQESIQFNLLLYLTTECRATSENHPFLFCSTNCFINRSESTLKAQLARYFSSVENLRND